MVAESSDDAPGIVCQNQVLTSSTSDSFIMGFLVSSEPSFLLVPFFEDEIPSDFLETTTENRNMVKETSKTDFQKSSFRVKECAETLLKNDTMSQDFTSTFYEPGIEDGSKSDVLEELHEAKSFSTYGDEGMTNSDGDRGVMEIEGDLREVTDSGIEREVASQDKVLTKFREFVVSEKDLEFFILQNLHMEANLALMHNEYQKRLTKNHDVDKKSGKLRKTKTVDFGQNIAKENWRESIAEGQKKGEKIESNLSKDHEELPGILEDQRDKHSKKHGRSSTSAFEYIFLTESSFDFIILNSFGDVRNTDS